MKRFFPAAGLLLASLLLGGCFNLSPSYAPPPVSDKMPLQYKEEDGWKTATPMESLERGLWWEMFGDQTLNELVAKATASLARQIIGDGEGASHDIRVKVTGATTEEAALACGRAVAASNLLKCAISGNDPNWGRIVSSLGTVPSDVAPYDSEKVTVDVNGVRICENGGAGRDRSEVDMTPREVHIDIDLNAGEAEATVWTDDLTHEYVHINADYES